MSKQTESSMFFNENTKELQINPRNILVIDAERRNLPFKSSSKIRIEQVKSYLEFKKMLNAALLSKTIELVFVDSMTRMLYWLEKHLDRQGVKGYDFWKVYANEMKELLMEYDSSNKFLVFTSLDDITTDSDSIARKSARAQGGIRGEIESYFDIVVHTHFNPAKERPECYMFETNTATGKTTAKSPDEMFDSVYIQNSLAKILGGIYDFRDIKNNPDIRRDTVLIVGKSGSGKSTSLRYAIKEN